MVTRKLRKKTVNPYALTFDCLGQWRVQTSKADERRRTVAQKSNNADFFAAHPRHQEVSIDCDTDAEAIVEAKRFASEYSAS